MNPDVFVPTERRLDPSYLRRLLHDIDLSHHTIYCSDWPPGDPKMFPPIRTNQNRYSNWNQSSWPDVEEVWSAFFISKSRVLTEYLLQENDIMDLCFIQGPVDKPNDIVGNTSSGQLYLQSQIVPRSWEKYGGPLGLKYAQTLHKKKIREKRRIERAKKEIKNSSEKSNRALAKGMNVHSKKMLNNGMTFELQKLEEFVEELDTVDEHPRYRGSFSQWLWDKEDNFEGSTGLGVQSESEDSEPVSPRSESSMPPMVFLRCSARLFSR